MVNTHINYATHSHDNTDYSHSTHSSDTTNSVSNGIVLNVNNISITDERPEMLARLSPLESLIRHQDIRSRRADVVGQWMLHTDEFRRWCDGAPESGSSHATLFCCGDPAVGKTYFSSLVVDRLCDKAKGENIAVACFYVDFAAREEQSAAIMLGSLLKQIVGAMEGIPDEVTRDYEKVIDGRGLRVPEISEMLQTITSLQPTFICIDALDECAESHRPEILDSLRKILKRSASTRLFLTGRQHIWSEIESHLGGRTATLTVKPNNDDIVGYIRMRLSKDTSRDAMDSGLENEIVKSIAENIPKTFLLVSLTVDAILRETTVDSRRQMLRTMTDGFDLKSVYGETLKRIKEQDGEKSRLGIAALMWISHSERLLQLDELLHALAVDMGSTDLNLERIPSVETLLSSCLGLVVVDREASVVRLAHFTLQEYLSTCHNLFGAAHAIMAETCLTYLNLRTINEISPTRFTPPQSTVFLSYSSLYWGVHARRDASREVVSLALKFFNQIESHISTKLLLADLILKTGRYTGDIPIDGHLVGFTGLHCASAFGIVEIAAALLDQPNPDINKRDFLGITPLIWAAICGKEEAARLLLEQQTTIPDKPDNFFRRTPLSWAARGGHERTVGLFLGMGSAKTGGADGGWSKMPGMMNKILRRRYVNPNRPDKYGQTPILLAAEEGHEAVVKVLLGRKDVKPDVADGYSHTALLRACSHSHEGVVRLLVERGDVNINRPDISGETVLFWAVRSGYERVVELLLGRRDVNPNTRSGDGQTLLSLAVQKGHDGVVKLLLGREDLRPDRPDNDGRIPLLWAAENGRDGAVGLLLGREDVNPNIIDNIGRTPLLWATMNGHDGVVSLLLGQENVNPNMPDNHGRTPLLWATINGYDGVAKLLLGREDVNPNLPDNRGRTAFSWATTNGRDGVANLLLGRGDINPDMSGDSDQTPL